MDRVLVLKKRTTDHGAEICYDGPVYKERLDIISNALSGKNDIQEQYEPGHEFFFPEMCSIPKQLFQSKKNKCLTNCKLSYFQSIQWFKNVLRVIVRDRKGILGFGTLAAVCALTIQFGTNSYNGNNPENIMLTLFSLAAPWLCAMFAAISVSELNRYYAWEHFSGLRSAAFLFGTVFAHAVPAFCIALIFTFGLFVSPRNCEIVKKWVCRGITADTSEETISNRLWFVKKEDRPDFIETCRDYASSPVNISLWYTPLKRGDSAEGLDKALTYSPIMTLHNDLAPNRLLSINYPLAKHKARELPKSMLYVFCIILLIMWSVSWCGSMIGITSAITLGNAKNAAVSIIVIFLFYVLFSRLFISSREAMSYLQPLAEIPTNMKSIDFQDMGVLIPIICSFVCLGRYTSNLLAYAFTGVSLRYDEIALCGIILVCLLVSFVVLTKKKMSK